MSVPVSCPVVIEEGETSNGASVPGLPGCVAVADTAEEVETLIARGFSRHRAATRRWRPGTHSP